jgi:hypothetical protein
MLTQWVFHFEDMRYTREKFPRREEYLLCRTNALCQQVGDSMTGYVRQKATNTAVCVSDRSIS